MVEDMTYSWVLSSSSANFSRQRAENDGIASIGCIRKPRFQYSASQ